MEIGGPGRNGFIENRLPDKEHGIPHAELAECFENGQLVTMRYTASDDTLAAIYRCERDRLGGQLTVSMFGPDSGRSHKDLYVFSVFDTSQDPGLDHLDNYLLN